MWTSPLFKCLFSFTLDHIIHTLMKVESYEFSSLNNFSKKFLNIYISQGKNFFLKRIYNSKIISHKKRIRSIRRMYLYHQRNIKPLKGSRAYQKDDLSRRHWLEGWSSKRYLHEVPHSQSLLCTIHGSFLNVKLEMTRSKRSADNSEKLVDPNG